MTSDREPAPLDLGPIDPSRDAARWAATAARLGGVAASRRRRTLLARQVRARARPALAVAATVTLAIWGGVLASRPAPTVAAPPPDPLFAVAAWAAEGAAPDTRELVGLLERLDDR
ncbi:MAG: hypothetical protein IT376_13695 [Polyangiaceae bacterium]|nr:hypothetical protein [Polyangiaceae bacterium]